METKTYDVVNDVEVMDETNAERFCFDGRMEFILYAKHCKDNGVEVLKPKTTFLKLVQKKGIPTRRARFSCEVLKEYKVLDNAVQGIRRSESTARSKRYTEQEPVICRIYGSKKNHVNVILPILSWTDNDVAEFIANRGIKCHPLYYDEQGEFHPERRLGCMGCPIASRRKRLLEFKEHPNMIKMYCRNGEAYRQSHPNSPNNRMFATVYDWLTFTLFADNIKDFNDRFGANMFGDAVDCKKFLEDYFNIKL